MHNKVMFIFIVGFMNIMHLDAYKFAVYGDAGADMGDPRIFNEEILGFINGFVVKARPKIDFVIFVGDAVNSATDKEYRENNLAKWLDFMKKGLKGIPLYPALGNHDIYGATGWIEKKLEPQYQKTFNFLPATGPKDYKKIDYSFEYGTGKEKSLFIALDSFGFSANKQEGFDNDYDQEQLTWFKQQAQSSDAPHKFVYMHSPIFSVEGWPIGKAVPELLNLVKHYNFDMVFCGHEHIYSRSVLARIPTQQGIRDLIQIQPGPSGSKPSAGNKINPQKAPITRMHTGYSFVIIEVQDEKVTGQAFAVVKDNEGKLSPQKFDEFSFIQSPAKQTEFTAQNVLTQAASAA